MTSEFRGERELFVPKPLERTRLRSHDFVKYDIRSLELGNERMLLRNETVVLMLRIDVREPA